MLGERALLPLAVAAAAQSGRPVRVLDFGGGMGISYVDVRAAVAQAIEVDYLIVETARVCEVGRQFYRPMDRVKFIDSLPETVDPIDVVYVRSALQYIEDYAAILRRLLRYRPRRVLFVELSAGDIPTYATAQLNVPGSVIPYWFHNIDEILAIAGEEGYTPLLRMSAVRRLPRQEVPRSHQLARACHLLLASGGAPRRLALSRESRPLATRAPGQAG